MTFYVYVAGRLSGPPPEYLANVHDMTAASRLLIDNGFCPINPAADALEGIMSGDVLDKRAYQERSLDLLRLIEGRPAAILVTSDHHRDGSVSGGVAGEIIEARRLGIPIAHTISELGQMRSAAETSRCDSVPQSAAETPQDR